MSASPVPSQTRIVNAAYAELGSTTRIESITDSTATRARALWDDLVAELLAEHPWNFQIKRARPNEASGIDLTDSEWPYAMRLPADCARWLPPKRSDKNYFRGEVEGKILYCDQKPPILIRYISNEVDVSTWSAHFVRAVVLRLAESMADGVTQSEGKKDRLNERAERALKRAKRIDGLETGDTQRDGVVVRSGWLTARMVPNSQIGR